MNPANRVLDGDMLTITMSCSYIVNSQHVIKPLQAKFERGVHTSVNMSYTWTLRNLTLPMTTSVKSATLFAGLGAVEFYSHGQKSGNTSCLCIYFDLGDHYIIIL